MSFKHLILLMCVSVVLTKRIVEKHYHYHFGKQRAHDKRDTNVHFGELAEMQRHFDQREREAGWLDLLKKECSNVNRQEAIANCAVNAVSEENCTYMLSFLKNQEIITEDTYQNHLENCK